MKVILRILSQFYKITKNQLNTKLKHTSNTY